MTLPIQIKHLGLQPYSDTWAKMQSFTQNRTAETPDEIWLLQHPPVFTQGLNGKSEHLLNLHADIPLVQTDRGGQITYHAPGQLIVYVLLDLKRAHLGVKDLVHRLERAIILLLQDYQISAEARADAPGVYVNQHKIASLGLKIKQHRSYHGFALNVDMDLSPFNQINPCGLVGMQMAQMSDFHANLSISEIEKYALKRLLEVLAPEISITPSELTS